MSVLCQVLLEYILLNPPAISARAGHGKLAFIKAVIDAIAVASAVIDALTCFRSRVNRTDAMVVMHSCGSFMPLQGHVDAKLYSRESQHAGAAF
jgi:hypothetical protein